MRPELTPNAEQQAILASSQPELNILAGAGCGKTTTLLCIYEEAVRKQGLSPEQILLITFTEKAASELKERLLRLFASPGDEPYALAVRRAPVGTIHSFCRRLLVRYAAFSKVPPAFDLLDENRALLLRRRVLDQLLEAEAAADSPDLRLALDAFDSLDALRSALVSLHNARASLGSVEIPTPPAPDDAPPLAPLLELLHQVKEFGPSLTPTGRKARNSKPFLEALEQLVSALDARPSLPSTPDELESLLGPVWELANKDNVLWPNQPDKAPVGQAFLSALENCLAWCAEVRAHPLRCALSNLFERFEHALRKARFEAGVLDYDDLQEAAVELLEQNPQILAEVRSTYRLVLLDEAQDVNFPQHRLVELLTADKQRVALRRVGDPLQSIYAWRGALPELFLQQVGQDFLPLSSNYRSVPRLIDFVNAMAPHLYHFAGAEPPRARLKAARPMPGYRSPARVLVLEHDALKGPDGKKADQHTLRTIEAEALARFILQRVGNHEFLVSDPSTGRPRPARFGDFALLFRANNFVPFLQDAFDRAGVPYFLEGSHTFYHRQEVQDLVSLLRVLENVDDELSLAAVLRSPLVDLPEEALFDLAADPARPAFSLWRRLCAVVEDLPGAPSLSEEAKAKLCAFHRLFHELENLRAESGPGTLLHYVLDNSPFLAALLSSRAAARRYANVGKLLEYADQAELDGLSCAAFIHLLEEFSDLPEARESEAALLGEQADVVRLMTLHKAKGLEFPIVLLCDLERSPNSKSSNVGFDYSPDGTPIGVVVKALGFDSPVQPASFLQWKHRKEARERRETANLFYVGFTRARDWLVLSGLKAGPPPSPAEAASTHKVATWLKAALAASGVLDFHPPLVERLAISELLAASPAGERKSLVPALVARKELLQLAPLDLPLHLDLPFEQSQRLQAQLDALLAPPPAPPSRKWIPVSWLLAWAACPLACYYRYFLRLPEELAASGEGGGGDEFILEEAPAPSPVDPLLRGSAVHRALQLWRPEADLNALAERVAADFDTDLAPLILQALKNFAASPFAAPLAASPAHYRELRFLLPLGKWYVSGVMDAVFTTEAGPGLLEYKTLAPSDAARKRAEVLYRPQVMTYALALQRLFGRPPARAVLFFTADGSFCEYEVSSRALQAAEEEVLALLEALSRPFEAPPVDLARPGDACTYCPWRDLCPQVEQNAAPGAPA